MKPVLIGTASDARGFALAGVDVWVCQSLESVEQRIDDVVKSETEPLILFSAAAYDLAAGRCSQWRREGRGPMFVVLPR